MNSENLVNYFSWSRGVKGNITIHCQVFLITQNKLKTIQRENMISKDLSGPYCKMLPWNLCDTFTCKIVRVFWEFPTCAVDYYGQPLRVLLSTLGGPHVWFLPARPGWIAGTHRSLFHGTSYSISSPKNFHLHQRTHYDDIHLEKVLLFFISIIFTGWER